MHKNRAVFLVWIIPVVLLHFIVHWNYLDHFRAQSDVYRYNNEPLLTTNDGYFFLTQSRDLGGKPLGEELLRIVETRRSLLAYLTVFLHRVSGIGERTLAFYLPPVLASFMILPCALWGSRLKRPEAGLIAAAVLSVSPYWFLRTHAGYFDTDCLIPFWIMSGLYLVWAFVRTRGARRYAYLAGVLAVCGLADLWWPQTRFFTAGLCFSAYALTVFTASSPAERWLKAFFLVLLLGLGAIVFTDSNSFLPSVLTGPVTSLKSLAQLVLSGGGTGVLPGAMVGELGALGSLKALKYINGSYLGLLASIFGLILLAAGREWAAVLVLLPLAFLSGLMAVASRFAIFFLPLYALGVGYLLSEAYGNHYVKEVLPRVWHRRLLTAVIAASIMIPSLSLTLGVTSDTPLNAQRAGYAERIGRDTRPGTVIWSEWSLGYFLEWYSHRRPFVHGGTLSPLELYLSTAPLAMSDEAAAANWMRFFAAEGVDGFNRVEKELGDRARTIEFFKAVFSGKEAARETLARFKLPAKLEASLFPKAKVAVYLDYLMLRSAPHWFEAGTWDPVKRQGAEDEVLCFEKQGYPIEAFKNGVTFSSGIRPVGNLISVDETGRARKTETGSGANSALVGFPDDDYYYFAGDGFRRSVFYKLLVEDSGAGPHFRPLIREGLAGLWLVE